ncbi:MAG: hypothetical protein ABI091_13645 [Ferruginibacter sp.]
MIAELKEIFSNIEQLKDEDQMQIAKLLKNELSWDTTLQNSQKELGNLAKEALHEYKTGKTKQTDW